MRMPSLFAQKSELASSEFQLKKLNSLDKNLYPSFSKKLLGAGLFPLKPTQLEILQINVGKMCNQTCGHCHVDAGPDRKEIMTRTSMEKCLALIDKAKIKTVDLTGGAPEMNPDFRWFVTEIRKRGAHVIDRCNLTIILANPKYHDLPDFFRENQVEVVSSLPHYTLGKTDRQRGDGVFAKSIKALQMLNEVGYGRENTNLKLNLVYNPTGAFLPGDQIGLEKQFKVRLEKDFGIVFNNLFCITNMPISRYLEYLDSSGNFEEYMKTLIDAFNPIAAKGVMCRNLISVGWDGQIYDCDFNQMLDMPLSSEVGSIEDIDLKALESRNIQINQHCYGCTAGNGSSCGGTTS